MFVDFGMAAQNDGVCYLRFDDTNPEAEKQVGGGSRGKDKGEGGCTRGTREQEDRLPTSTAAAAPLWAAALAAAARARACSSLQCTATAEPGSRRLLLLQEYIDHIQEIVGWLGWKPWKVGQRCLRASLFFRSCCLLAHMLLASRLSMCMPSVGS